MKIIEIKKVVSDVIRNLSSRQYQTIYEQDVEKNLSAEIIEGLVSDYGGKIHVSTFEQLDECYIYYLKSDSVRVEYDLIIDGKRSDLTITLIVSNPSDGEIGYALKDLHIL